MAPISRAKCWRQLSIAAMGFCLLLTQSACVSASSVPLPPPARLNVTVALPPPLIAEAEVDVSGPNGASWQLRGSTLLSELEAGTYRIQPQDLVLEGVRYIGLPKETTVNLDPMAEARPPGTALAGATVAITYLDPETFGLLHDVQAAAIREGATTYHVDCEEGADSRSGHSPATAFRSLERVNQLSPQPGDRILLRRGCTWTGPLVARWSGSSQWPITVGAYGEGTSPTIQDAPSNNVDVHGSNLVFEHLRLITSPDTVYRDEQCEDQLVGWRSGLTIHHSAKNVLVRYVEASGNTVGIHITRGASDNRIINNYLHDNVVMSVNTDDGGLDDSGAWGVLLNGTDNVIAYNRFARNTAWCSYDFGQEGAAIEVYEGLRNLIHHNVALEDTTFSEIGGSDVRRSANNVYAFNLYRSSLPNSQFLVLRGEGGHFGPTPGTRAFNNTVVLTSPDETQGVVCYAGCNENVLELRNNILWVEWKALYADGPFAESNNIFWRENGHPLMQFFGEGNAMSATSMIADPQFVDLEGHDLRPVSSSPAVGAGAVIDIDFPTDLAGLSLDQLDSIDLGALLHAPSP